MAAHYIVVHEPPKKVNVNATVLQNGLLRSGWNGNIYVDRLKNGCSNEDPFVFNNPWVYSFCKITFLRIALRPNRVNIENGSYIFFANNQLIKQKELVVDTVFVVNDVDKWVLKAQQIPAKFIKDQCNTKSLLWERHFKFGIRNGICNAIFEHSGKNTLESILYIPKLSDYSFLPYINDELLIIPFDYLPSNVSQKLDNIKDKRTKYPLLIDDSEKNNILNQINSKCDLKILKDIV